MGRYIIRKLAELLPEIKPEGDSPEQRHADLIAKAEGDCVFVLASNALFGFAADVTKFSEFLVFTDGTFAITKYVRIPESQINDMLG